MEREALSLEGKGLAKGVSVERETVIVPDMKYAGKKLRVWHVSLPDGSKRRWEGVERSSDPTALVCGLTREGEVILIDTFRFPVEDRVIELPGGVKNPQESDQDAAAREFREETGYTTDEPFEFLTEFWAYNGLCNAVFHIYLAKNCYQSGNRRELDEVEEAVGLRVFTASPREIFEGMTTPGNRRYDPPIGVALFILSARLLSQL